MVKYRCENDNVDVGSSICPHCGQRAFPMRSELYWCDTCNVPNYTKECSLCGKMGKKLSADLRPVFPEEKILLETIMESQENICLQFKSVWNGSGNIYYADGKRLAIRIGKLAEMDIDKVRQRYQEKIENQLEAYQKEFQIHQKKFTAANKDCNR